MWPNREIYKAISVAKQESLSQFTHKNQPTRNPKNQFHMNLRRKQHTNLMHTPVSFQIKKPESQSRNSNPSLLNF